MNVIPTASAPPAPPATSAAGASSEETDARLAGAFAALVDALTAQVDHDGADGETLDVDPGPATPAGEDAEATEALPPELAVAPGLLVWPTPPPARTGRVNPTDAAEDMSSQLLVDHAPAGDPLVGDPLAGDAVVDAADVQPPATEAAPTDVDAEPMPPTVDHERVVDGQAEPGPADGAEPDVALAEAAPVTLAGADSSSSDVADGQVTTAVASTGSAPVRPAVEVIATAQAATTRAPAPSLPDQLVEVVGPLRQAPDGTHRVSVQLRPDELGEVLVDVRVRGNEVSLSIRADLAGTADLLRDAVGELRAELEAAGFRSGDVDVSSHPDRRATQDDRRTGTPAAADRIPSATDVPAEATPHAAASSGLDVRL